jgi:hypothetical protein
LVKLVCTGTEINKVAERYIRGDKMQKRELTEPRAEGARDREFARLTALGLYDDHSIITYLPDSRVAFETDRGYNCTRSCI